MFALKPEIRTSLENTPRREHNVDDDAAEARQTRWRRVKSRLNGWRSSNDRRCEDLRVGGRARETRIERRVGRGDDGMRTRARRCGKEIVARRCLGALSEFAGALASAQPFTSLASVSRYSPRMRRELLKDVHGSYGGYVPGLIMYNLFSPTYDNYIMLQRAQHQLHRIRSLRTFPRSYRYFAFS